MEPPTLMKTTTPTMCWEIADFDERCQIARINNVPVKFHYKWTSKCPSRKDVILNKAPSIRGQHIGSNNSSWELQLNGKDNNGLSFAFKKNDFCEQEDYTQIQLFFTRPKVDAYGQMDYTEGYDICSTPIISPKRHEPMDLVTLTENEFNVKYSLKCHDGILRIRIEQIVYHEMIKYVVDPKATFSWHNHFQKTLSENKKMLLETSFCSDVSFIVDKDGMNHGTEIQAHRAILSARSPVFRAMFEHNMMEMETGKIMLTDISEKTLGILLKFIYIGELDKDWTIVPEDLTFAADKYQLMDLREFLDENLPAACTMENVSQLLACSKACNLESAEASIKTLIVDNGWK